MPDVLSINDSSPLSLQSLLATVRNREQGRWAGDAYKVRSEMPQCAGSQLRNLPKFGAYSRPVAVYSVRTAGHALQTQAKFCTARPGGGVRAAITHFSPGARRNFWRALEAVEWDDIGEMLFVTLTYPGDFPLDGRRVKRDLRTFHRAWEHEFGRVRGAWKLEFQSRGAPHFHLALSRPAGRQLLKVQEWVSSTWYRVVGSGDVRHLWAGTNCQVFAKHPGAYFVGHGEQASKEYQQWSPDEFTDVGRYWGLWGLRARWNDELLSEAAFLELRRLLDRWQLAQPAKLRRRRRGRVQGQWHCTVGRPSSEVLRQLMRGVVPELSDLRVRWLP